MIDYYQAITDRQLDMYMMAIYSIAAGLIICGVVNCLSINKGKSRLSSVEKFTQMPTKVIFALSLLLILFEYYVWYIF